LGWLRKLLFLAYVVGITCTDVNAQIEHPDYVLNSSYLGEIKELATIVIKDSDATDTSALCDLLMDRNESSYIDNCCSIIMSEYVSSKGQDCLGFNFDEYDEQEISNRGLEISDRAYFKEFAYQLLNRNLVFNELDLLLLQSTLKALDIEDTSGQIKPLLGLDHSTFLDSIVSVKIQERVDFIDSDKTKGNLVLNCPASSSHYQNYCCGLRNRENRKKCKDYLWSSINKYTQDRYYGIENGNFFGTYDWSLDHRLEVSASRRYVRSGLNSLLHCHCSPYQGLSDFKLDIPGGNILVGDDFVLIGKDELFYRFLDKGKRVNRLKAMGVDNTLSDDQIRSSVNKILSKKFFGDRSIVWVGTEKTRTRYHWNLVAGDKKYEGHSPCYHIDLFIALLGNLKSQGDTFYYLLGRPSMEYQNDLQGDRRDLYEKVIGDLNAHIDETVKLMEKDCGGNMKAIVVPLPIRLKNEPADPDNQIDAFYSFPNALVENVSGKVNVFVPDYSSTANYWPEVNYKVALDSLNAAFNKYENLGKRLIKYDYSDGMSGLHCLVKVLKRGSD